MKVVVVGAGLAGLTAASDLTAAGVDTTVFEARHRVGGRTRGIEVGPGSVVDAGGAYLGDRHTELHAMLDELGLKTTPTTMLGASRFALRTQDATRAGRFPPLNAVALGEMFELLDQLTTTVRLDAPWLTPHASTWDSLTAAEWAEQNLRHPDARLFFPLFLGEMMAADPGSVSVLHMAFYLRSGGGVRYLNAFEGGAQQDRVDGGAHQVCEHLAARLGPRVRLGQPVRAIHQTGDKAIVHADGDGRVRMRRGRGRDTAAAGRRDRIPTGAARGARGGGNRPRKRREGAPRLRRAAVARPRALGLVRQLTRALCCPLSTTRPRMAESGSSRASWPAPRRIGSPRFPPRPSERRRSTRRRVLFPELPPPIGFHATDWVNARYSRGCYAALFGPGDWVNRGPYLTTAHGRVHWAGTETSTEYFGLMEGAIRSGHRAAHEVLSRPTKP